MVGCPALPFIDQGGAGVTNGRKRKKPKVEKDLRRSRVFLSPCACPADMADHVRDGVAEPPNLMPLRSARLLLDTKHSRENTKLLGFVGHTPGENPKIHIRIINERIKLTSFSTSSYITLHVHQSIIFINITME